MIPAPYIQRGRPMQLPIRHGALLDFTYKNKVITYIEKTFFNRVTCVNFTVYIRRSVFGFFN